MPQEAGAGAEARGRGQEPTTCAHASHGSPGARAADPTMSEACPCPPRLAALAKWDNFPGYGFNLHAERNRPGGGHGQGHHLSQDSSLGRLTRRPRPRPRGSERETGLSRSTGITWARRTINRCQLGPTSGVIASYECNW